VRASRCALGVAAALAACAVTLPQAQDPAALDARLREARREIARLQREVGDLRSRERGILDELARLGAEQRLQESTVEEIRLRLEIATVGLNEREDALARLHGELAARRGYLAFRLRELYKHGPGAFARKLVVNDDDRWLPALRYAHMLGERDAQAVAQLREGARRVGEERARLDSELAVLAALQDEAARAVAASQAARYARERALRAIRDDQAARGTALEELEGAERALAEIARGLPGGAVPELDIGSFRGLLDWPTPGRVSARFGRRVHPRLGTTVPQRGLEIATPAGTPFRAVFDGRVAFAGTLRGYGLTAIVDHGGGTFSVYAHAATLMVDVEQEVVRGEILGHVGDTGSLDGPGLYFELRRDGQPVDPEAWLRPR